MLGFRAIIEIALVISIVYAIVISLVFRRRDYKITRNYDEKKYNYVTSFSHAKPVIFALRIVTIFTVIFAICWLQDINHNIELSYLVMAVVIIGAIINSIRYMTVRHYTKDYSEKHHNKIVF